DERLDDLDGEISRPVLVESMDHPAVLACRERSFMAAPRQRGSHLHVRERGGRDHVCLVRSAPHDGCALLVDVELYEGAGIEVEPHPRSSITAAATGLPFTFGGRFNPRGLPPAQRATPTRSMASMRWSAVLATGGEMTATGRPRSVTTRRSPARARFK